MTMKKALRIILTLVLVACIAYSAYKLYEIFSEYGEAEEISEKMRNEYHPQTLPPPTPESSSTPSAAPVPTPSGISRPNPSILDAQNEVNRDIVGFLTVPGTSIDYFFVLSADNSDYLKRAINGASSSSGSIFMDYRNNRDFTDFNNVLYGHNMKSGKMFHNLRYFAERSTFDSITTGTIYLPDRTYSIHFFAYLVVDAGNERIYNTLQVGDEEELKAYLDYVKRNAQRYREIDISFGDQVVTLSSCAYDFKEARMVLLGKLEEEYL